MEIKELNMDVLKSILNAYPYEVFFCDRTHPVRFINKAAKERYGDVVQVGRIFNWDFDDPGKPVAVPNLEAGY